MFVVRLFVRPSVCLVVCLSVCLYVCLYDCPLKYVSRDNSKIIQAILIMLMKLCVWTSDNVLIMHVIFYSPSHEHCGCYGNENIQNVAKTYGSRDKNYSSYLNESWYVNRWLDANYARHFHFAPSHENVVAMVTEIVKLLQ